ncbi:MAG: hypothetical protein P1U46_04385 [Patescibacteria group bacterium]|nr:hypothetical protein [Patescibacteria group bacterium]
MVRKICPYCKEEKEKTAVEKSIIEAMMKDIGMSTRPANNIKLYH